MCLGYLRCRRVWLWRHESKGWGLLFVRTILYWLWLGALFDSVGSCELVVDWIADYGWNQRSYILFNFLLCIVQLQCTPISILIWIVSSPHVGLYTTWRRCPILLHHVISGSFLWLEQSFMTFFVILLDMVFSPLVGNYVMCSRR